MFLFQLPKSLPLPRSSNIVERKGRATGKEVKEGSNLQQLPQGYLGKMLVYKSGKVKMKLGDVMFDVSPQLSRLFVQILARYPMYVMLNFFLCR
jgi:DNA-directed RNA polymerase III subunit RPC4